MSLSEFPKSLPIPDSIKETCFSQFSAEDLCDDEAYADLVKHMFFEPETEFYLYLEQGLSENAIIQKQLKAYGIFVEESEFYYYLIPGPRKHYMKIKETPHPKLKEIKKNSKHYVRGTLRLSNRMREHLNNKELVSLQKAQPEELVSVNPGIWGITFNLKEIVRRFKKLFRS